ncbi:BLUF domain-containing protein [Pseudoprimorskyibacter insulae]|uniref:Blue light- and temperature-regulated antirepressor BluF n=1 Tax=Pseudoprimorskyibacter insulae TaxID=1695997 RepID=A0A2R8APL6_9RHOB|nr:BLUF domain-containing protein [Pseudoprimorskyibacter insulae]SPF77973.1 Blue light- and temperature-regulated antirepressor BluF [Pseudoprimorskyibacter insulae]
MSQTGFQPLYQLMYTSLAVHGFGTRQMRAMLPHIRSNNLKHDLSGMLLFADGEFFQVLEGPRNAVKAVFAAIELDERHSCITVLREGIIARRAFTDWSMGFAEISPEDLSGVDGMNDFYLGGTCYSEMKPGWEKVMITSFMRGKWPGLSEKADATSGIPD